MSVQHALLGFLSRAPQGVYQLRQSFIDATTWPINIGQVYQTIQRLERDGLVRPIESDGAAEVFELTGSGRAALREWIDTPLTLTRNERDELTMKILIAARTGQDVSRIIQTQRKSTIAQLHELTKTKAHVSDPAEKLLIEHHIFELDSRSRWLDHIEPLALEIARAPQSPEPPQPSHDSQETS